MVYNGTASLESTYNRANLKPFWTFCYILHTCIIILANSGLIILILSSSPSKARPRNDSSASRTSSSIRRFSKTTALYYQYLTRKFSGTTKGHPTKPVLQPQNSHTSGDSEVGTASSRRGIKKSRINLLIAWLSFSDLLIALICLPLYIHYEFFYSPPSPTPNFYNVSPTNETFGDNYNYTQLQRNNLTYIDLGIILSNQTMLASTENVIHTSVGQPQCYVLLVFYFFSDFGGFSNSLATIFIALDRFRAIAGSMKYKNKSVKSTGRYAKLSIDSQSVKSLQFADVWTALIKILKTIFPQLIISLVSVALSMPIVTTLYYNKCTLTIIQEKYYLIFHTLLGIMMPLFITSCFYVLIIHILRRHKFATVTLANNNTQRTSTRGLKCYGEKMEMLSLRTNSNTSETKFFTQINNEINSDVFETLPSQKVGERTSCSVSNYSRPPKSRENELKAIRLALTLILMQAILSAPVIVLQILEIFKFITLTENDPNAYLIDILKNALNIFCLTDRWLNVLLIFMFCKSFRTELRWRLQNVKLFFWH